MSSQLLIHEPPLQVLPTLAKEIGLNEAIVLQQLHYWITISSKKVGGKKFHDGKWWVYNTYEEWSEEDFPFWSVTQIGRYFRNLEALGLVLSERLEASDWCQRKWYTIDYAELNARLDDKCTFLIGSTETSTETTTDEELVMDFYKLNYFGKKVEPVVKDAIVASIAKYGKDAVLEAMTIAAMQKKKTWAYIDGILKRKANPSASRPDVGPEDDGGWDL